ncbi:MAG: PilN domain-containing protein [Thiohalomonadaceae bacterium]
MSFQQINLYQPIFRKQEKVFSAKAMAQSAAVVVVGLLAFYGFGVWQLSALEAQREQVEQRRSEAVARMESLRQLYPERSKDAALEARVQQLARELDARTRIATQLGSGAEGNTRGFSAHLAGLARQRPEPLWLTHIGIAGGGSRLRLSGSALQPEAVPRFLQRLSAEPAFAGAGFRHLQIQREEASDRVEFTVQSTPPEKEEK